MKTLFAISIFSFCHSVLAANSIDLGSFETTGELKASQAMYRQEVSYVPYETTCTERVPDGTRTSCRTVYENHCRKVPGIGDDCTREPIQICEEVDTYRTETYPCTQHRRVTENVYDHTVFANIEVTKTLRAKNFDLNGCILRVSLQSGAEEFDALCKNAQVKVKVVSRSGDRERSLKVDADFASVEGLEALQEGLSNLVYDKGVVSFNSADLRSAQNFSIQFKVTRNRLLLKDKVVFTKTIKISDLNIEQLAGNGRIFESSFNLKKWFPEFDASKKHTLSLTLKTVNKVDVTGAINTPKLSNELTATTVVNE